MDAPGDVSKKKVGRKPKYATEEERIAGAKENKAKYRTVTVHEHIWLEIDALGKQLTSKLGFRPTMSQVIAYLLARNRSK
jgi:hypothetical protein